jgi:hypothetical protein
MVHGSAGFTNAHLANCVVCHPEVEHLDLSGSDVSSEGLAELASLTELIDLDLSNTFVDDNAVPHLKLLSRLKFLNLSGTFVSQAAMTELGAALPDCVIYRA